MAKIQISTTRGEINYPECPFAGRNSMIIQDCLCSKLVDALNPINGEFWCGVANSSGFCPYEELSCSS